MTEPVVSAKQFAEWSRVVEVVEYAERHGITQAEAVERLVNSGLSHERISE